MEVFIYEANQGNSQQYQQKNDGCYTLQYKYNG